MIPVICLSKDDVLYLLKYNEICSNQVMPLKNKAADEWDFSRRCGLLSLGMTIVIALYIAIGFLGYLKYGDHVLGSITLNLPPVDM